MSSKTIKAATRTTAFRLAFCYSSIFIVSSLAFFLIAYLFLTQIVVDQDRKMVNLKIDEYDLMERNKGINALLDEIRQEHSSNQAAGFFVRLATPDDSTLLMTVPKRFRKIDFSILEDRKELKAREWFFLHIKGDEDMLEIESRRLSDGYILQIGKGSEEREELLEHFRELFAMIMIPVVLIGILAGAFMAYRSLRPLRDLIGTVKQIDTGRMDARVPSYHTGDELDELVRLFNGMLQKIQNLITGMQEALDNVAHDLRTPVTRMRSVIETTLQGPGDEDTLREALMDCAEESERICSMLKVLLDISEAEAGVIRLDLKWLDLKGLLQDIVDLYQFVAEEKGIDIDLTITEGLKAELDEDRIKQVVANLLDNAVKYSPEGGSIKVDARQNNHELVISVEDNGKGISSEEMPRIFDRLYRGDKSRTEKGLGLGLSLVKAVVSAHGGRVEVSSTSGKGSCFKVVLPISSRHGESILINS